MDITITFPDGKKSAFAKGSTAIDIAMSISEGLARAVCAAKFNDVLIDASQPLEKDGSLELLKFESDEGRDVFWHSSAHLLAQAVLRVFPEAKPTIGPVIEEGFYYDFDHPPFSPEDLVKIEAEMKNIVKEKLETKRKEMSGDEALKLFKDNKYKCEIIKEADGDITAYEQGDFIDLCRGPHLPNTGMIKSFKLTKVSAAYWRGDAKNASLQRIYGVSYPDKKLLKEYLVRLEEAAKRDHRRIGNEQELFFFDEHSPGSAFYEPKGAIMYRELVGFIREQYWKRGYKEVMTPVIYDKELWETSGHWEHYQEDMFTLTVDDREFALKPMNCPSHLLIFKHRTRSYRDLPLRIADFAPIHRNELKGVLSGLTRVRKFCQDDAHIFCTEEQMGDEMDKLLDFVNYVYEKVFGIEYYAELSTRPEKFLGEATTWDKAEVVLESALKKNGVNYKISPGDGAFYGPKIDIHMKDALGRSWQVATLQLDFQMPARFKAEYMGDDNKKHTPIMIHRAVLGAPDRFLGVYIEHCAGRFPLWISPVQVAVLTLADRHLEYAKQVEEELHEAGLRVEIHSEAATINKKVRNAQLSQINYILIVGDKEQESGTVNVRTRDNQVHGEKKVNLFVQELIDEVKSRRR